VTVSQLACSHAIFERLDFIDRLAALLSKPLDVMTCLCRAAFVGWSPANSRYRVTITLSLQYKAKQALPTG
jgi:hypothetical protein